MLLLLIFDCLEVLVAPSTIHSVLNVRTEGLPEPLRQMAYVRLENPQASLGELGKLLDPPVGKSGVNHRLRKLGELAKELKVK